MAFLRSMNPNRVLNEKIEQLRVREKKKLTRLNSNNRTYSIEGNTLTRRDVLMDKMSRRDSSLEDLGPVENYLYLIDPDIKKGDEPIVMDKAQQILMSLNNMETLAVLMNECNALLSSDHTKINGKYLEKLLGDVKTLYQAIEMTASREGVVYSDLRTKSRCLC